MDKGFVGQAVKRTEDPRFLTGSGNFVDNMNLAGQARAAMVRSPYAHATIRGVDASKALALPGVVAVIVGQDLVDAGINGLPVGWLLDGLKTPDHLSIAVGKVRHVGEIVAAVIAEDRYLAEDATGLVKVDYEVLPAVMDVADALETGAPTVHDDAPGNVCFEWSIGDKDATDAAFAAAAETVPLTLRNQRLIANAIEPRASLAQYSAGTKDYTLYTTSQNPHVHRLLLAAFILGIPEHKLRVVSPDVGGGFGSKIFNYPEEVIVLHAARKLNRPVKWTAKRSESFLSDSQGRDHATEAELAVDENGHVTGLRVKTLAAMGAYLTTFAPAVPTYLYGTLMSGQYKLPNIYCEVTGVFSHTVPVDAYRGAGRPEATFVVERLMSRVAQVLGEDPAEFRRKNFIGPDEFPYQTPVALAYDSGNYEPALDKALEMVSYRQLRQEQEEGPETGTVPGHRPLVVHRGLRPGALGGGRQPRRPGGAVGELAGARLPDGRNRGLHRLAQPRAGA